jgi:PAS domain S-box-containing protein
MLGYAVERWTSEPDFWVEHIHPDDREWAVNFCVIATAEMRPHEFEYRMIAADGRIVWLRDIVTVVVENNRPTLLRGVMIDVTERKRVETALREREDQYRSIFESSTDGLFINDLNGHLVDFNPAAAHMHGYTEEEFRRLQPERFIHPDSLHLFTEYIEAVRAGEQYSCQAQDVRKDGTQFHIEIFGTGFTYKGQPHALAVVRDVTERAHAQQLLEQRVAERTRELSALLEVSRNVVSMLELKPLLGLILEQLDAMVSYDGAALLTLHGDELAIVAYRGPAPQQQALQSRFSLARSLPNREIVERREPLIIADVHDDTPLARAFRESVDDFMQTPFSYIRSWIGIPMMSKERVIGMMGLDHKQPNYYTEQHARLALAIANQAAVAIENARLYEQAQSLAALEERQRLARELHDSVSQALYGIALGARAARGLLDRDAGKSAEALDYVLSLAEAGLSEMRALIFELRPESLEKEGLVAALEKQAASIHTRHQIEVQTNFCDEPPASPAIKEALYRVAQEALNNVVKHAHAERVELQLTWDNGQIGLDVRDDGAGFDAGGSFPGHLGLQSMRERIERLNGAFEIESRPGQGTRVHVSMPLENDR